MIDEKWVGKFADMGTTELPTKEASPSSTTGREGRVQRALQLWRAGLVYYIDDAKDEGGNIILDAYQVRSQTNKNDSYFVMDGICDCRDKKHNGGQECKHEIAVRVSKGDEIDGVKYSL